MMIWLRFIKCANERLRKTENMKCELINSLPNTDYNEALTESNLFAKNLQVALIKFHQITIVYIVIKESIHYR